VVTVRLAVGVVAPVVVLVAHVLKWAGERFERRGPDPSRWSADDRFRPRESPLGLERSCHAPSPVIDGAIQEIEDRVEQSGQCEERAELRADRFEEAPRPADLGDAVGEKNAAITPQTSKIAAIRAPSST